MLQDILDTAKEKMKKSCDVYLRGVSPAVDLRKMRGNLFLQHNRNVLDPLFGPYSGNQLPVDR